MSPQGAGVMEYFGFILLSKQGVSVSQVLALTLSIRFVQIFWNLVRWLVHPGRPLHLDGHATYDEIADEDSEDAMRSRRAESRRREAIRRHCTQARR